MKPARPAKKKRTRILKRNPVAKALGKPAFGAKVVPSKKLYKRPQGGKTKTAEAEDGGGQ